MLARGLRFLSLPFRMQALLIEAALALTVARVALWLLPFRRIASRLGQTGAQSSTQLHEAAEKRAAHIGFAVDWMGRHLPWENKCLHKSLATTWMLQRRGIPSTLYFGVRKQEGRDFSAHAWVRCGHRLVSGAEGHETFKVISTFARPEC